jgi:hypothetical protein|tara:strand:+ start:172 stop:543 length:372 start_codon:yes stop_codon:yes gene_type:complete
MKVSDNTSVALPLRNLVSIIGAVAIGVWAYFGVIERLNKLETSDTLFEADLLKKAEQTPKNLEIFMLIEELFSQVEKLSKNQEMNMSNKIKIEFIEEQLHKALSDIEKLKDANREMKYTNGTH